MFLPVKKTSCTVADRVCESQSSIVKNQLIWVCWFVQVFFKTNFWKLICLMPELNTTMHI